jgi:glutathione peroxidase
MIAVIAMFGSVTVSCHAEDKPVNSPLEHKLTDIDGKEFDLSKLKGKVVLIVNVASECGYTPQYKGLQELYEKYEKDGFVVIGIPSNEFGRQEPGTDKEIKEFCSTKYKVTFPMMSKSVIKGDKQIPLYRSLLEATRNDKGEIQQVGWNFEKFLIGRDGRVVGRFKSGVEPTSDVLIKAIKAELDKAAK